MARPDRPRRHRLIVLALLMVSGCNDNVAPAPAAQTPGRAETQKLRAADAAGYDGKALQYTVDTMLDTRDQHNNALNQAAEANEAPTAP